MDFGTKLKQLRKSKNITQENLAKNLGVGRPTIAGYETKNKQPDFEKLAQIALFFHVTVDYLLGLTDYSSPGQWGKAARIPILGNIRAGLPVLAQENWEDEACLPGEIPVDFALQVKGDSMSWVGIHNGDLALMRQADTASHGTIVAVGVEAMEWEATLKFYIQENGQLLLRAANPAYQDTKMTNKHRIIGQLVKIIKNPPSLSTYRDHLIKKELADEGWTRVAETAAHLGFHPQGIDKVIEAIAMVKREQK